MKDKRIRIIWKVILLSLMLLSMIGLIELVSISSSNRVNSVAIDTSDLLWYYQNLDSNDRQNIRQAMDYAIPRDQIITDIFNGYSVKIASPIAPNMLGYDPMVQARDKNITKALELLKDVFGYQYDGTNPYFKMTLTVPDTNQNRVDWATLVNQSFKTIGIDVELVTMDWNTFSSRHWNNPVDIGYDYSHGGSDGLFIGFNDAQRNSNWSQLTSDPFPPDGYNVAWIKNSEVDTIWDRALTSTNRTERSEALKDFQSWCYDTVPMSAIPQMMLFFAVNSTLKGLDTYLENNFQNFTMGAQTSLTYAVPDGLLNLNPLFVSGISDEAVRDNLHGCLMKRRGTYNITHPVGFLADSWTTSPDGLVWTINLRQGVQWHDTTEVNASDVVFTYHAVMNDSLGSPLKDFFNNIFDGNKNNIEEVNKYTVKFTFPTFYPFAETEVFSLPILQKAQMKSIPFTNWKTHGTNTGTIILNGFGPYKYASNSSGVVTIAKSNSYNDLRMGHDPSAMGGGIWWPNASIGTVSITKEPDPNNAVNGLIAGTYDAIHPGTYDRTTSEVFFNYADTIDTSSEGKLITGLDWSFQGLYYNQYSPIWGMNPGDPREMYPDEYPPTVKIVSPTVKTYSANTITVELSGDAKYYSYYIAGVDDDNQTWTEPVVRTLVDGTYTLHAYGDNVGNVVHESMAFTVDTTAPTLSIDSPTAKTYTTDTISVDLSGDAEDYLYYIAGADSVNQTWTGSVSRTLADGTYTLHAYGDDAAGNVAHKSVTFVIDTTVPTISIDSPTPKTYTTDTITVDFSGDAEEYWYYITGADSDNQTWNVPVERTLTDDTYTLHAYGEDGAGNVAHKSVTFTIDTTKTTTTTTTTTEKKDGITPGWDFVLLLLSLTVILPLRHYRKKS
jgi:ABC-type transport system substrate-binding protein